MSDGHDPTDGEARSKSPDVVIVGGPSEGGQGVSILRVKDDHVQTGELRAVVEGKPIVGDLVKLSPRAEHARLFDVEVLASGPRPPPPAGGDARGLGHKGPPRVASTSYRSGWERIFGARAELEDQGDEPAAPANVKRSDLN
jgi:hypothetical protein